VIISNPCSRKSRGLCAAALAAVALTVVSSASAFTGTPFFSGVQASFPDSIRAVASDSRVHVLRQTLTASEQNAILQFSISLKMPNFDDLEARIASGERIAPDVMEAQYLPSVLDYVAVENWLIGQGFTITMEDPNHTNIFASGTVAQIESSLGVNFARVATADGQFTSATSAPNLPVELAGAVLGINGLQPHLLMHPYNIRFQPNTVTISGTQFFEPSDIASAYSAPGTLNGTGQTIAILMSAKVFTTDLNNFYQTVGSSAKIANFTTVLVNGGPTNASQAGAADEAALDVEWSSGMAPGANIRLYAIPDLSDTSIVAGLTKILADAPANNITVVSFSAGGVEDGSTSVSLNADVQAFANLANAGISVFVASGDGGSNPDTGAGNGYVAADPVQANYPASDVNVMGVGGTELVMAKTTFAYVSESVFSTISNGTGAASGGGVSKIFNRPSWQVDGGSILANATKRCVPDISVVWGATVQGDNFGTPALVVINGSDVGIGGTSLSCPIWAGIAALINQARVSNPGGTTLGLLGPLIYPLHGTPSINDITTGNNGFFLAGVGYDLCTGLGSPNITNLASFLSTVKPIITAQPQSVTVNAGSSFSIFVTATGNGTGGSTSGANLSYQWYKNGVLQPGVTGYAYSIFNTQLSDAGSYTVIVSDSAGSISSSAAKVTVNAPPPPASSGGGGGALSYEFYLALAMLLAIRKVRGVRDQDIVI
jgi:kumamolisin